MTIGVAEALLLFKTLVVISSLRAGAEGGLLTPGIAIGASLGTLMSGIWNWVWPGSPPGAFAVVGGTAFLASSMKMPLTAIVLMMELTRVDHDFLIPLAFAVVGSISASRLVAMYVGNSTPEAPDPAPQVFEGADGHRIRTEPAHVGE